MARTRTARRRRRVDDVTLMICALPVIAGVNYLIDHPGVAVTLLAAVTAVVIGWIARLHRRILTGRPVTSPMRMSPAGFEQHVAGLLARSGASHVRVAGGAGDLGADVIALDQYGRTVVVQCKRYNSRHKVGSEDMQRFVGTARPHHRADVALFVTSSRFTRPALAYAAQHDVVTVDGVALNRWQRTGHLEGITA